MKLSKEQIAKIDETLVSKDLVYDDIKLELTDHIASDIEEIMTNRKLTFEVAFKEVFRKWKGDLKIKSNALWAPFWKKGPKLFMDKWAKECKKLLFLGWFISIIVTFFLAWIISFFKSNSVINIVQQGYEILSITTLSLLLIGRFLVYKSESKTTFSNMFNVYFIASILVLSMQIMMIEFENDYFFRIGSKFIMSRLFSAFLMNVYWIINAMLTFKLLYKHFQFERKLSKV